MLKLAIGAVVLYCGFVALLYVAQRRLQYFPERRRTVPRAVGLPEAEEAVVGTRRWRAGNRLACSATRGTARISLFPRQWRFAALAG